ncbi:molecular chaperone TorD family protein [Candidatus Kuenenia sp.]|uniref:TorD/DmsD family molecular chaperone n=1 Tax=Candidatus Kuenenia sp. TaxID=2499824 RepID=UPI00321FC55D
MVVNNSDLRETDQVAEVGNLLTRSALYQVLSTCYLFPEEKKLSILKGEDFNELVERIERCYTESDSLTAMLKSLKNVQEFYSTTDIEKLQRIYNRVVGHTISKDCPLYEGQYGAAHVFQQVQDLADIQGFYRAFGLDISEEEKERCDHISVELEFLQFLLYKQAYAIENHGKEEAEICLDAQKKFLKEHAGKWMPLFALLFGKKSIDGFYFAISEVMKEFIKLEMDLLGVQTETFKESDLNQDVVAGAPDECLSCASSVDEMGDN